MPQLRAQQHGADAIFARAPRLRTAPRERLHHGGPAEQPRLFDFGDEHSAKRAVVLGILELEIHVERHPFG
jgi:hypothetical protein